MDSMSWISGDYHFPSTYSIRVPSSSMTNTKAMPAPGPGTIRLAMIRTGIEIFGFKRMKDVLFPQICSAEIRICPPERVTISANLVRVYKAIMDTNGKIRYQEGFAIREYAHSSGYMTVFLAVTNHHLNQMRAILENIGYWGQASSLTHCVNTSIQEPILEFCGLPVEQADDARNEYFSCFVSEFANKSPEWQEVMHLSDQEKTSPLRFLLYLWPLKICRQYDGHTILRRSHSSSH